MRAPCTCVRRSGVQPYLAVTCERRTVTVSRHIVMILWNVWTEPYILHPNGRTVSSVSTRDPTAYAATG